MGRCELGMRGEGSPDVYSSLKSRGPFVVGSGKLQGREGSHAGHFQLALLALQFAFGNDKGAAPQGSKALVRRVWRPGVGEVPPPFCPKPFVIASGNLQRHAGSPAVQKRLALLALQFAFGNDKGAAPQGSKALVRRVWRPGVGEVPTPFCHCQRQSARP
jgi:hypothetical protein